MAAKCLLVSDSQHKLKAGKGKWDWHQGQEGQQAAALLHL